jgi:hypothetical protein
MPIRRELQGKPVAIEAPQRKLRRLRIEPRPQAPDESKTAIITLKMAAMEDYGRTEISGERL